MAHSLADLKRQCTALNLGVSDSKDRAPYLAALRAHYLVKDYPNGLPYEELFPMQCFNYWDLSSREQSTRWADHNQWIAQEKLNGCRVILHFIKNVGVFAHSRNISQATFRRQELADHLLFRDFKPSFSATVDCEALIEKPIDTRGLTANGSVTRTSLHSTSAVLRISAEASLRLQREQAPIIFYVLDIANWEGSNLKEKELAARLSFLTDFKEAISKAELGQHFAYPSICFQGKRKFLETLLAQGKEGCVLKFLGSRYDDSSSRNRYGWIKVKREVQFDGFVSGFEQGRPGSKYAHQVATILFSISTEKSHHMIAKCSNLPWAFRKEISIYDGATGRVRLEPSVYGRVARLSGQEFSARACRLVHPGIVHWRSEMTQDQCRYADVELQALRQGETTEMLRTVQNTT